MGVEVRGWGVEKGARCTSDFKLDASITFSNPVPLNSVLWGSSWINMQGETLEIVKPKDENQTQMRRHDIEF